MEFDNSRPIWIQLVGELSRRIAVGSWEAGERIPGVRELALELGVNPNTLQRAFGELERDQLVRVERAAGRFVTADQERITNLRKQLATTAADEFVAQAAGFGMSLEQACAVIERRWRNDDPIDVKAERS